MAASAERLERARLGFAGEIFLRNFRLLSWNYAMIMRGQAP